LAAVDGRKVEIQALDEAYAIPKGLGSLDGLLEFEFNTAEGAVQIKDVLSTAGELRGDHNGKLTQGLHLCEVDGRKLIAWQIYTTEEHDSMVSIARQLERDEDVETTIKTMTKMNSWREGHGVSDLVLGLELESILASESSSKNGKLKRNDEKRKQELIKCMDPEGPRYLPEFESRSPESPFPPGTQIYVRAVVYVFAPCD
jgi:hypothetical protein